MNKKNCLIYDQKSQPLIRHCWVYNIYKKKLSKIYYKEKFVNFLTKDGKKSKAYKLFNKTGLLIRRKILQIERTNQFFTHHDEAIDKIKILFFHKLEKYIRQNKVLNQTIEQKLTLVDTELKQRVVKRKLTHHPIKFEKTSKKGIHESSRIDKKIVLSFNQLVAQAIENVKPNLEVRKVRIAGTTYLVPAIIQKNRQQTLAIKWLVECARSRKRGSFIDNLANELIDAFMKQGQARQKRDDLHKLVEANRAYTRYRWW